MVLSFKHLISLNTIYFLYEIRENEGFGNVNIRNIDTRNNEWTISSIEKNTFVGYIRSHDSILPPPKKYFFKEGFLSNVYKISITENIYLKNFNQRDLFYSFKYIQLKELDKFLLNFQTITNLYFNIFISKINKTSMIKLVISNRMITELIDYPESKYLKTLKNCNSIEK